MKYPDKKEFITAIMKEITYQMDNGKYYIIPKSQAPTGETILTEVRQMKSKRDIKTRAIKKRKARPNIDGSSTKKGIHYKQTYVPFAYWN